MLLQNKLKPNHTRKNAFKSEVMEPKHDANSNVIYSSEISNPLNAHADNISELENRKTIDSQSPACVPVKFSSSLIYIIKFEQM